jgi:hypothetical protein
LSNLNDISKSFIHIQILLYKIGTAVYSSAAASGRILLGDATLLVLQLAFIPFGRLVYKLVQNNQRYFIFKEETQKEYN